jgi:8-oxo-dGTP pyrophosphatase MutT (NUDIX family)
MEPIAHEPIARQNIRLAASVLLVRDAPPAGIEVFMVQRPGGAVFPNLHVFPGGKVDETDFHPDHCPGFDDRTASELLGVPAGGLRYWVAAIRECFEECGVLLASRRGDMFRVEPVDVTRFAEYQHALIDGRIDMGELCVREGLELAWDRVVYLSHWLTPPSVPRRFDTRFFVANMPGGQRADAHASETTGGAWIAAADALQRHASGAWQMISPTLVALGTLAGYADTQALVADVRAGRHAPAYTDELGVQGMQPR